MTALQLSPKIAARIRRKLRNSSYGDAERLLTAALHVLDERDKALKRDVALGIEAAKAGDFSSQDVLQIAAERRAARLRRRQT